MSADELWQAAATLRERAEAATEGPWTFQTYGDGFAPLVIGNDRCGDIAVAETHDKPHLSDARYIATVHPGVGLALAKWLDATAERIGTPAQATWPQRQYAFDIARLINRGAA